MKKILSIGFAVVLASSIGLKTDDALARGRSKSGTSKGRHTGGTYHKTVTKSPGSVTKDTTWQNDHGEGSREVQRTWDKDSGIGTYTSTTTTADGKIITEKGTFTKNADGSLTERGTLTDPQGETKTVERTIMKEEDGSTMDTTSSGPDDKSFDVDNTGKSGTITTQTTKENSTVTTEHSVMDKDGKSLNPQVNLGVNVNTMTGDVINTNPNDESHSFRESVSIDEAMKGK